MADDFNGLDPGFLSSLQGLMGVCGLSLTSGFRTHDEQARLYAQKPNLAAPPGHSNHERGLAADISGDLDCAHRRAAEFGLRFPMDYEPWHIEPADVDNTNRQATSPPPEDQPILDLVDAVFGGNAPSKKLALSPEEIAADVARKAHRATSSSSDPSATAQQLTATGMDPQDAKDAAKAQTATPQTGAVTSGGSMSTEDIARAYAAAGFTGEALVTMVAISLGESGGNPQARNLNGSEDSRGLSQINTFAHPQYDPDRLYDPNYNAQAAFEVSGGGQNFGPWTVYSRGLYEQYMDEARAAVAAIGGGGTGVSSPQPAAPGEPAAPETEVSLDSLSPRAQPKKLSDFGGVAEGTI